jgi:hypothetical protein
MSIAYPSLALGFPAILRWEKKERKIKNRKPSDKQTNKQGVFEKD